MHTDAKAGDSHNQIHHHVSLHRYSKVSKSYCEDDVLGQGGSVGTDTHLLCSTTPSVTSSNLLVTVQHVVLGSGVALEGHSHPGKVPSMRTYFTHCGDVAWNSALGDCMYLLEARVTDREIMRLAHDSSLSTSL